jgi:hypothetical protein
MLAHYRIVSSEYSKVSFAPISILMAVNLNLKLLPILPSQKTLIGFLQIRQHITCKLYQINIAINKLVSKQNKLVL